MNTPKTDQFTYRNDYVLLLESHRQLETQVQELREIAAWLVDRAEEKVIPTRHEIKINRAILEKTK